MKLKYFAPVLAFVATLLGSCADDNTLATLDNIKVSTSYVAIPESGGTTDLTLNANADWTVNKVPSWLTVNPLSGAAGEHVLHFTADAIDGGRSCDTLYVECNGEKQRINVIQGKVVPTVSTVKEAIDGPETLYRIKGIVTGIYNTTYGNWFLVDNTGKIQVYGTLDEEGRTKNFSSLGIEEGDEVIVEGPKTYYNGTPQLKDVSVIKHVKWLVKVDSLLTSPLSAEGGTCTAYLSCKGQGVSVEIPEEAQSWLSILSVKQRGLNAEVVFKATSNAGQTRSADIKFLSTDGKIDAFTIATITQNGMIPSVSVSEFLAAPKGENLYKLSGVVRNAKTTEGSFELVDFSGKVDVYKLADFANKGIKENDIVTIIGKRDEYKGKPQMGKGGTTEKVMPVTPLTLKEVMDKEDNESVYYYITATISRFDQVDYDKGTGSYGNLYLKDGDTEMYLYGLLPGYGATGDNRKGTVPAKGLKVGDKLTIIAVKTSHNGKKQLKSGIYISHESSVAE